MGQNLLVEELQQHPLFKSFWSEQIHELLEQEIILEYEPIGEFGIYSKYFEFCLPYIGIKKELYETKAFIKLGITANGPNYDIQKALNEKDCFHNVQIQIRRNNEILATNCFRLWSKEKDEYSGKKEILTLLFYD